MAAGEFSCRELSLDNIWQQYFSKDKQKIKTGEKLLKPRNQKLCFFFSCGEGYLLSIIFFQMIGLFCIDYAKQHYFFGHFTLFP